MRSSDVVTNGLIWVLLVACAFTAGDVQAQYQQPGSTGVLESGLETTHSGWTDGQQPYAGYVNNCAVDFVDDCTSSSRFRFTEFNIYPTFSFLGDQVGNYAEFEFASHTDLGRFELENRTVLNVADLPGTIKLGPANPDDGQTTADIRGNGFGDVLSGFFFSRKRDHRKSHFGVGPVITFPTGSNEIVGSGQWTIGPGAHFSTEIGRLTTGFFVWNSWGLTDDPNKKRINQLFGKPFLIYELSHKWNLIYVPLGMSHSWKSPSGDDWTVPVGGGLRRLFEIRGQKMGIQVQAFDYVARKPKDPEWEMRFTIEFLFD